MTHSSSHRTEHSSKAPGFRARYVERWIDQQRLGNWDQLLAKDSIGLYAQALAEGRLNDGKGGADLELFKALKCAYANRWDYAADFLKKCLKAADWAESSGALTSERAAEMHPFNLGQVRMYRVYAKWLLGEPLDGAALRNAAELCFTWFDDFGELERGHPDDDPISHVWCMEALRPAMISGDVAFARQHLKRLHLRWYMEDQRTLYLRLLDEYPKPSQEFRSDFERWFDLCRDPDAEKWHKDLSRVFGRDRTCFEVGLIRQMYLVNPTLTDPLDPRAVIDAISA